MVNNSRKGLLIYTRPPVVEMVSGVQFQPLAAFKAVHFGAFGKRIKDEYPETQDQPELGDVVLGQPPQLIPQVVTGPAYPRVFYISERGDFLLQVQRSRFHTNWRKQKEDDGYPNFNAIYSRFREGWKRFTGFLLDQQIGQPIVRQYELQYVNHVLAEPGEKKAPAPERYLRAFSTNWGAGLPTSTFLRLQVQMPKGKGFLDITAAPGLRGSDQRPVLLLDLIARGAAQPDCSDLDEWFSLSHEFMVNIFTDVTSEEAHSEWGLK